MQRPVRGLLPGVQQPCMCIKGVGFTPEDRAAIAAIDARTPVRHNWWDEAHTRCDVVLWMLDNPPHVFFNMPRRARTTETLH